MSKLIDNLNRVQVTMTEKPNSSTVAAQPAHPSGPGPSAAPAAPNLPEKTNLSISPAMFYSIFASVFVIVVLALVLSYRAFTLITVRNTELTTLANVIKKQNEKIKSLEDSVVKLSSQQSEQLAELNDSITGVEKIINQNTKELAQMAVNQDALSTVIKDLKSDNKEFQKNYTSLAGEINRVKQMFARMLGEGVATPQ